MMSGWAETKTKKLSAKMSTQVKNSAAVHEELDDVTTCCICDETYRDPRILPCVHTFCLACLQQIGTHASKKPGDQMPCPVCRQEFTIPDDGFAALKKNFFMVKLIEIATNQQRISSVGQCDKHEHENLCLYCNKCDEVLCMVCLRERHRNHQLCDLGSVAEGLRSQLKCHVSAAKHCVSGALKKKVELLQKKSVFFGEVQELEAEVNKSRHDLKVLIDQYADLLLRDLRLLKMERTKEFEIAEKKLVTHLDCLRNFEISTAKLESTDLQDSLFCKTAIKLKEEIDGLELMNKSVLERQLGSFDIRFKKTALSMEPYSTSNIIGEVEVNFEKSEHAELVTAIGANNTAVNLRDHISGMAVSYNEVFIAYGGNPVVSIYDTYSHEIKTQLNLESLVDVMGLTNCVSVDGNVYIANSITSEILHIDQNLNFTKWSTEGDWGLLSVSPDSTIVATGSQKKTLREYSLKGNLLHEIKLCPSIIHPMHAIKLGCGRFAVSHGRNGDEFHQVCIVNDIGTIAHSFGGFRGSSIYQLNFPNCLAVDENGCILVLDSNNSRVLLLSSRLSFQRVILTKKDGLRRPVAMQLDKEMGRLYIADNNWETCFWSDSKVLAFDISKFDDDDLECSSSSDSKDLSFDYSELDYWEYCSSSYSGGLFSRY